MAVLLAVAACVWAVPALGLGAVSPAELDSVMGAMESNCSGCTCKSTAVLGCGERQPVCRDVPGTGISQKLKHHSYSLCLFQGAQTVDFCETTGVYVCAVLVSYPNSGCVEGQEIAWFPQTGFGSAGITEEEFYNQ